jgi:hypothetical protein
VGIIPSTCVTTFFFAIHLLILFLALVELGPLFSISSFCLVKEFSNNVHCSYAHKVIFFLFFIIIMDNMLFHTLCIPN